LNPGKKWPIIILQKDSRKVISTDNALDRLFTVFAKLLITVAILLLFLWKGLTWLKYILITLGAIGIIGIFATVMIEDYKENREKGSK
jgi:mannose/fructose/N-acetylgalactosamine-specific phosphotransferase system component IID